MNTKIFLSIAIILLCFSCKSKTKQVVNANAAREVNINSEQKTDMAIEIQEDLVYFEIPQNSSFQNVIANFYKYKDENRLFEGLDINYIDLTASDTLLIFNFEKGTVRGVHKRWDDRVSYVDYIKGFPTDRTISGDFNGDRKIDILKLGTDDQYEKLKDALMLLDSSGVTEEDPRYEKLNAKISELVELSVSGGEFEFVFSDKKIPGLKVMSNLDYTIKNEGDLDGDGGDEIGFLYGWGTSHCRSYTVFTLKHNKWYRLIEGIESTYDTRATGVVPVEKDPEQEGVILIRSSNVLSCNASSFVVEKPIKIKDLKLKRNT